MSFLPPTGALIGYARSSRHGCRTVDQVAELHAAGVDRIYVDTSSTASERMEFMRLLAASVAGDTVVVTRLGRLGPSAPDLALSLGHIDACRLHVRVLNLAVDTRVPGGLQLLRTLAGMTMV